MSALKAVFHKRGTGFICPKQLCCFHNGRDILSAMITSGVGHECKQRNCFCAVCNVFATE